MAPSRKAALIRRIVTTTRASRIALFRIFSPLPISTGSLGAIATVKAITMIPASGNSHLRRSSIWSTTAATMRWLSPMICVAMANTTVVAGYAKRESSNTFLKNGLPRISNSAAQRKRSIQNRPVNSNDSARVHNEPQKLRNSTGYGGCHEPSSTRACTNERNSSQPSSKGPTKRTVSISSRSAGLSGTGKSWKAK